MIEKEIQEAQNAVNDMLRHRRKVPQAMLRDHRTLQQDFTRVCCEWLEALAQETHSDARNEASIALAKAFIANVPEKLRYLPCI